MRRARVLGIALLLTAVTVTAGGPVTAVAQPTSAPAASPRGHEDDGLRAAMRATVDAGASGMIARVDNGRKVTRVGVGYRRLEPQNPIHSRDQVRVGSITKSMVATVVLQLVGEGKLRLDDTVEHWLPGLVPGGAQITIKMLLNHTSGIYNYTDDPAFMPAVLADPYRSWSPRELIAIATSQGPVFAPGTQWSYSNTGYIIVGLIAEKATGSSIEKLLHRRVIKPLHLNDTFFATTGRFRGPYAHGYIPPSLTGEGYLDASGWPPTWAWAAGAVVSNAEDLARFYTTLMSGRLLAPKLLAEMTTTVDLGPGAGYGLGIFAIDTPCGVVWGHEGDTPGYVSYAYTDQRGRRSVVVLLPTQPDDAIATAAQPVVAGALCAMFGQPVPAAAKAAAPDKATTGWPRSADRMTLRMPARSKAD